MLARIFVLLNWWLALRYLLQLDEAFRILFALQDPLTPSHIVEQAVLAHHELDLRGREAFDARRRLRAAALIIQLRELTHLQEVLNDLLQVLGHAGPVVGVELQRELDVKAEYLDRDVARRLIPEYHPCVWHLFDQGRRETVGKAILVMYRSIITRCQFVHELHVDRIVADLLTRVKLVEIVLDEAAEAVVEGGVSAVATLELVPGPRRGALVLEGNVLYLLHLILLVQELPDELFVLDVPVVQRLDEVLLEDVLELSKLVVLCLLQVLQLAAKAFFQLDQLVAMK